MRITTHPDRTIIAALAPRYEWNAKALAHELAKHRPEEYANELAERISRYNGEGMSQDNDLVCDCGFNEIDIEFTLFDQIKCITIDHV